MHLFGYMAQNVQTETGKMKIFILPLKNEFLHVPHVFNYPDYSKGYIMEMEFYQYLIATKSILTDNPAEAQWHYLPVGWTDYYINSDFSQDQKKMDLLEKEVHRVILDPDKTFTVCQYDDGIMFNSVNITTFLASRKSTSGIDIPLLAKPIPMAGILSKIVPAVYKTSFVGRTATHPLRADIPEVFSKLPDAKIVNGYQGSFRYFLNLLLSKSVLAPRGYGDDSFRFYEAMQMGRMPILIAEKDTRPFKQFINWDECSFYFQNSNECLNVLLKITDVELKSKGQKTREVWEDYFSKSKWCHYVIQELKLLKTK